MRSYERYYQRDKDWISQNQPSVLADAILEWLDRKQGEGLSLLSLAKLGNKMKLNCMNFYKATGKPMNQMDPEGRDYVKFKAWLAQNYNSRDCAKVFDQFMTWYKEKRGWKFTMSRNRKRKDNPKQEKYELVWEPEDILKVVDAVGDPKLKALFALQGWLGARPKELYNLRIKDIIKDERGFKISIVGAKHTGTRYCRMSEWALPYLLKWLDSHPLKDNPETYLWVTCDAKGNWRRPSENWFVTNFAKITKMSGVDKPHNPNWFRHSSLSTKAANNWTPQELSDFHGNSFETATRYYIRAKRGVSDNAVFRDEGKTDLLPKKKILTTKQDTGLYHEFVKKELLKEREDEITTLKNEMLELKRFVMENYRQVK